MSIAQDLHDRLRAALPPQVPVLLPDEFRVPLAAAPLDAQGRPAVGQGERGLGVYLQQHPQGYVQVYDPQPITTTSGIYDEHWATVDAIAPTDATADALLVLVRRTLGGTPRTGGRTRVTTPPRTTREPGSVRVSLQFSVRTPHPR